MNSHKYLFLEKYSKVGNIAGIFTFAFLIIGLITDDAHANFATTESSTVAACPANHKMYYVGANPPSSSTPAPNANVPVVYLPLSWTSGNESKSFTFEGNKEFVISFPKLLLFDLNSSLGTPPFYGSLDGITTSAINLDHDSTGVKTNHNMNVSINRSVSKVGYKIQDLDSTVTFGRVPYIEEVDVSANQGQLTFNTLFHTRNPAGNVVTARSGLNCGTGECTIDANWNYNLANTPLNLKHNNTFTQRNSPHTVGYSDFYFCLAPPKLIVKKVLDGTRAGSNDQFEINTKVDGTSTVLNQFTTAGSAATLENSSSSVQSLKENTIYNISENIINGNASNYSTSYSCTNATTGIKTVIRTGTGSSFTLSNLSYGDEITCTITNTPGNYTFTGFVFNDNGGIARSTNPDTKSDISTTFTGNSKYFNGIFDNGETGIGSTIGLTISLTNCDGVNIGGTTSQTTSDNPLGQYKFTVPVNVIAALSPQKVCIVQAEPDPWVFSVDTTPNIRNIDLQAGKLDYKTEGSLNLDFGEVEGDYAALVLRKAQYVNDCRSTLNYTATNINTAENTNPRAGFSESGISGSDLTPGQCIAYRITATNRANLTINNFVMRDVLQKKGENNALVTSVLIGVSNASDYANDNVPIGKNGTVKTTEFVLNPKTVRNFYFNTKYGTTVDAQ